MGTNAYTHDEVMAALRQTIEGRHTLIAAVREADAAETDTPERFAQALQRVRDVMAANIRLEKCWRRRWKLAGKL
jgi:hypothetical protein